MARSLGLAMATLFVATQAMGYTINVDFAPTIDPDPNNYEVVFSGSAAAPDTGGVWNALYAANDPGTIDFQATDVGLYDSVGGAVSGPTSLVDSLGNSTGITATFTAGGSFATSSLSPDNDDAWQYIATDAKDLMRDYLIAFSDGEDDYVLLEGFTPGQEVLLHLYGEGDNLSNNRSTKFVANGVSGGTIGDAGNAPLTEGADYTVLSGVMADASGSITILYEPNPDAPGEGPFNGLQVTTVPEPGSFALVGVACLGLMAFRRKQ